MGRHRGWLVIVPAVAALATGCGEAPSDLHVADDPATVELIDGTDLARVTLTESAIARLDLHTAPVERAGSGTVVPTAAIVIDPNGGFWVYTSPEPGSFVRAQISVDREDGDRAYLLDGPPVGTEVVTLGATELYGSETGIGK